jgi:undecaprenyl diphosphate synthase
MAGSEARVNLIVKGKVQGVRFRASTRDEAKKLGITGFAKNLSDGSVEVVAEGEKTKLERLLHWCLKGPLLAEVQHLSLDWKPYTGEYSSFTIVRDKKGFIVDQLKAFKVLKEEEISLPEGTIIPKHIAIIPDGNRRWAKERGKNSNEGHKRGFENLVELVRASRHLGVKHLTVWGFSTENWNRNEEELEGLMNIFAKALDRFAADLHEHKARFKHLGRKDRLNKNLIEAINQLEESTKSYDQYYLNIALDYGGQDEILRAVKKAATCKKEIDELCADEFSKYLDTEDQPYPDLIIRTSGEQRLSGLMPWQSVYAELYFAKMHFPDFSKKELTNAILEFSHRNRRFGK